MITKEEIIMPVIRPTVTIRWQATSDYGVLSGEFETRLRLDYHRKLLDKVRDEIKAQPERGPAREWLVTLTNEPGEVIVREYISL